VGTGVLVAGTRVGEDVLVGAVVREAVGDGVSVGVAVVVGGNVGVTVGVRLGKTANLRVGVAVGLGWPRANHTVRPEPKANSAVSRQNPVNRMPIRAIMIKRDGLFK
jgi:hypothetical protein